MLSEDERKRLDARIARAMAGDDDECESLMDDLTAYGCWISGGNPRNDETALHALEVQKYIEANGFGPRGKRP